MCGIEWGKCEVCGKEGQLERTYFYYNVKCECCGDKNNRHFEMVCHCSKCPAPVPVHIHPWVKALDGKEYKADICNMLPIQIEGKFIIDKPIIKKDIMDNSPMEPEIYKGVALFGYTYLYLDFHEKMNELGLTMGNTILCGLPNKCIFANKHEYFITDYDNEQNFCDEFKLKATYSVEDFIQAIREFKSDVK